MAELAALSLVCNVIQITDYSIRILAKGYQIHKSGRGVLPENEALEECTKQLLSKNIALERSLDEKARWDGVWDNDERALGTVAQECNDEARGLISKLKSVRVHGSNTRVKSIRSALKSVWAKDEIEAMSQRMEMYQKTMDRLLLQSVNMQQKVLKVNQQHGFEQLATQGVEVSGLINQLQSLMESSNSQQGAQFQTLVGILTSQHDNIMSRLSGPEGKVDVKPPSRYAEEPTDIVPPIRENSVNIVRSMIEQKPSLAIQALDYSQKTALHIAALHSSLDVMKILVKKGANINAEDMDASTPLHLAVKANSPACLRYLLFRGASKAVKDDSMKEPMDYTSSHNELGWILQYGHEIDATNETGDTALLHFVHREEHLSFAERVTTIKSLLAQGANVRSVDNEQRTALTCAAMKGWMEVIDILLEAGSDINHLNWREDSPLAVAAMNGLDSAVERLLQHDPELNHRNFHGFTPLFEACSHNHERIALQLIEKGSSLVIRNNDGNLAIHLATKKRMERAVEAMLAREPLLLNVRTNWNWTPLAEACDKGGWKMVKLLLGYGADTRIPSNEGQISPLTLAVRKSDLMVIRLMIKAHADIEARDSQTFTPLIHAIILDKPDIVEELLTLGADPNNGEIQENCLTPLAFAAKHASTTEITRSLIKHGARVNQRNGYTGFTPIMEAVRHNKIDMASVLLDSGADINLVDCDPTLDLGKHGPERYPPLNFAAREVRNNGVDMLRTLLSKSEPDLSLTNNDGWTALHEVAFHGTPEAIWMLLAEGADRNAKSKTDPWERLVPSTPLDVARMAGNTRNMQALSQNI